MRSRPLPVLLVPLLLVPVLLTACTRGGDDDRAANRAQAERLEEQLAELPGVQSADVAWLSDASTAPTTDVTLVLAPQADPRAAADAATGAVWRTRFVPLSRIAVSAYDPARPGSAVSESFVLADDADELERRFGPRPAGVAD